MFTLTFPSSLAVYFALKIQFLSNILVTVAIEFMISVFNAARASKYYIREQSGNLFNHQILGSSPVDGSPP